MNLTTEGQAAFPNLTDAIISAATPWHSFFTGTFGGLDVLATSPCNDSVPLPGTGVTVAESEPNDTSGTADTIALGDDYTGEITPSNESDFVGFSAAGGEAIIASTVLGTLPDSTLRLLGPDGVTQLAFNDDFASLASLIAFTLPAVAGTYFLQVQSFAGSSSGTYTLSLRLQDPTGPDEAVIIGGVDIRFCELDPVIDLNPVGAAHSVTATVLDAQGDPQSGVDVDFTVLSGPNAGEAGADTTDAGGEEMAGWAVTHSIGTACRKSTILRLSLVRPRNGSRALYASNAAMSR